MSVSPLDLHEGPWTEEAFLALPEDRRIELLDGQLLMSPYASVRHQRLSSRLWATFERARPDHLQVLEAVNLRVGAGRILIPDGLITTRLDHDFTVVDAVDVLAVLEITSPGSTAAERAIKPRLYAEAGIPTYIRVELPGPTAVIGRLDGDRYGLGEPDRLLRLREPFEVAVDLPELLAADRAI